MSTITEVRDGVGESVRRPDGIPKVKGEFAYSSDMWAEDMLWGATLRSPASARADPRRSTSRAALAVPGVHAVLTHEDVPGRKTYGLEHHDQPVLAFSEVRYQGEPVAIVAADHPETARRAADAHRGRLRGARAAGRSRVRALDPTRPPLHPAGNLLRHVHIAHGDEPGEADVVVSGEYEVGMQDQAFLGPESGLAVPAEDGGVDLWIATQWLHVDRDQVAACLDLPVEKVRFTLAGVGGAFGGREDVSMQAHACMLALHTGRPVKMVYGREESFFGHVHRHPARMRYEHGATRDGKLRFIRARILLDGGAYASSSTAVVLERGVVRARARTRCRARASTPTSSTPTTRRAGRCAGSAPSRPASRTRRRWTSSPPRWSMDPVELRLRNAMTTGTSMPTGAPINCPAPVRRAAASRSAIAAVAGRGTAACPAGSRTSPAARASCAASATPSASRTSGFSEGFDDYSTARVRLSHGRG